MAAEVGALATSCTVLGIVADEPVRLTDIAADSRFADRPQGHPPMRSVLALPIRVRGAAFGCLCLTDKRTGDGFTIEDEQVIRVLATVAGVAVHDAHMNEQSQRQEAWLDAAFRVTRLLLTGINETEVLTAIAELVRDLTGSQDSAVLLPSTAGKLRIVTGAGPVATAGIGFTVGQDTSLSGRAYRAGVTLNLSQAQVREGQRVNPGLPDIGPALLVPFGGGGKIRGVITASRPPGAPPFPAHLEPVVTIFAEQAELAYALAEHRRDTELASLFADRDRIARNLHEVVIQRLFGTGIILESAANHANLDPSDTATKIRQAVHDLDETIKELRTTVFALHDRTGSTVSLRAKIIDIVADASATLRFTPTTRFDGLTDIPAGDPAAQQLLTILYESLANISKHASANKVDITVSANPTLQLRITDNGNGLNTVNRRSELANLAARADQHGNQLTITNTNAGTQLHWNSQPTTIP